MRSSDLDLTDRIRRFYNRILFNAGSSIEQDVRQIRANPAQAYPDLHRLLLDDSLRTVLDVGTGMGWLANSIAVHYGKRVTGIDLADEPLKRAAAGAERLQIQDRVSFELHDLFAFSPENRFDLVISLGVLHHTADARAACRAVAQWVGGEGHLYLGLYHRLARPVFLAVVKEELDRGGEAQALNKLREWNRKHRDPACLASWFQDQVLNPHETMHTLVEVAGWLRQLRFVLMTSSLSRFQSVEGAGLETLEGLDREFERLARRRLRIEDRFFPGFFTTLSRRQGS